MNILDDMRIISDLPLSLGECPLWNEAEGSLYWIDWLGHRLYRTRGDGRSTEWRDLDRHCGSFAFSRSGRILLARHGDLALLDWESGQVEVIASVPLLKGEQHVNDGKCDPAGRFWFGTISKVEQRGRLLCYDPFDRSLTLAREDVATSNGLGWSPEGDVIYYADSGRRLIWKGRYDIDSGKVRLWSLFADFTDWIAGNPDGLCVDREGCVWVAIWDGYSLVRLSPKGEIVQRVSLPIPRPTSCAFGGPGLRSLMVTSAAVGSDRRRAGPELSPGNVFAFEPMVPGVPVGMFGV